VGEQRKKPERGSRQLFYRENEAAKFPVLLEEYLRVCDLRPTDHVLDVGCAEGWYTLEFAQRVKRAHGFDKSVTRIREAKRLAKERGIRNATFEAASLIGYPVEPLSYDMTLFSGVWGARDVGLAEVDRLLKGTRRQFVARIDVVGQWERIAQLTQLCDENGFDVLFFPGKIMIAGRRGEELRIPEVPGVAFAATTALADHPIVRGAAGIGAVEPAPDAD
jgi:SAM-dependent methyltransferase